MATVRALYLISSSIPSNKSSRTVRKFHGIRYRAEAISVPKLRISEEELYERTEKTISMNDCSKKMNEENSPIIIQKLYAIGEVVADRAEMHASIGEQRNNWNILLLNSINMISLTAATMAGASVIPAGGPVLALKISASILYAAATGLILLMNKIQPSQLAEEQRNATRLFKNLYTEIQNTVNFKKPTSIDVENAIQRILALDKAYPLPLLPGMLEKFPKTIEPTVWWPSLKSQKKEQLKVNGFGREHGWNGYLEREMKNVAEIVKNKDIADYMRLCKLVLTVNKILAACGPLLTGSAAVGAASIASSSSNSFPVMIAVLGGALACVVNSFQHGGQVGMVFELYRNCAGFYHHLEQSITSNLEETDVEKREDGEIFEMKVALQLGRSVLELRKLASSDQTDSSEFAGKLF